MHFQDPILSKMAHESLTSQPRTNQDNISSSQDSSKNVQDSYKIVFRWQYTAHLKFEQILGARLGPYIIQDSPQTIAKFVKIASRSI